MKTGKIGRVREAVKNYRQKRSLAESVGCSEQALYAFASEKTNDMQSTTIDALCRELGLNVVTGAPLVQGVTGTGKRESSRAPVFATPATAPPVITIPCENLPRSVVDALNDAIARGEESTVCCLSRA